METTVKHKLNKKLKLAALKSETFKEGNKKVRGAVNARKSHQREKGVVFKTTVSDRKNKRVHADENLVSAIKNKNVARKGQNKVKNEFSKVKSVNGSPRTMWSSKSKYASCNL